MSLGYLIDVQGTLISDADKSPLLGAKELIDELNIKNIPYCVITNNTKTASDIFLKELQGKGLNIKYYLDPFMVIKKVLNARDIYPFGPDSFCNVLESIGFRVDEDKPEALLIASHTEFNASSFAKMITLAQKGAKIIGMHGTSIYAKNGKTYPGVGAILAMLSYATSLSTSVVGKPSPLFYERALDILRTQNSSLKWEDITIVSDDAKGDLVGAKTLGMQTRLVLSGKVKSDKEVQPLISHIDTIDASVEKIAKEIRARD
ncbi:MAG: HAD-IIA family hydrolase [Campylobacteraceae bacterium]|nr:HAD-IIA family hydrolase [Campylobacteraceae bacterium]